MKNPKLILTYIFGAFMVFAGVNHFLKPAMYLPFIPSFFPQEFLNYLVGIIEVVAGVAVFFSPLRWMGTLAIFLMMLAFLPLHVIDVFSDAPAIGSSVAALIRLPLQFVLIAWAWYIHKK